MVFGKGQQLNVSELGRKGAIERNLKHGSPFIKLWEDQEWRKKKAESSRQILIKINNRMSKEEFSEFCSRAGKKSREREKRIAEQIKKDYDRLFIPSRICDRIALKDNKLVFIEIKPKYRQKLRPKQEEFRQLCERLGFEYKIYSGI